MIAFRAIILCFLLAGQPIPAQETRNISFRDFITLIEYGQADTGLYSKFFNQTPLTSELSKITIRVHFESANYVAILITEINYSQPEESSTLETYDWDGNKVDTFDYGYELGGDYYQKRIRSEIKDREEIVRTTHITEGALTPAFDQEGNQVGMDYQTVVNSSYSEYFRISGNGFFQAVESIITYYNMLKADDEQIRILNGKWCAALRGELIELNVADIENGYVEFKDPGTGGSGPTVISVALFFINDQAPVLVQLRTTPSTGICPENEYELNTYRLVDNKMMEAIDIVPPFTLAQFVSKSYDLKKSEAFVKPGRNVRIGYNLSGDKTLEAFLDASTLSCALSFTEGDLSNQRARDIKEFLDNIETSPLRLRWDESAGVFRLSGDQ